MYLDKDKSECLDKDKTQLPRHTEAPPKTYWRPSHAPPTQYWRPSHAVIDSQQWGGAKNACAAPSAASLMRKLSVVGRGGGGLWGGGRGRR